MLITIDKSLSDRIWFTGDHHFGHANIIKFCNRPFASVEEMGAALIANWNKVVKPADTVFHLGDFTLGDQAMAHHYFTQLNGNIHILANPWHHDKRWINTYPGMYTKNGEIEILPAMVVAEMKYGEGHPHAITLCHYPLAEWDRKHYGAWCLHGHSHGKYRGEGYIFDVGVDNTNFYPINLGGIFDVMYGMGWS